jgi:hypothetical protein
MMSKYKYWSTAKLVTLLRELELSVSGSHVKDLYLAEHIQNILCKRPETENDLEKALDYKINKWGNLDEY